MPIDENSKLIVLGDSTAVQFYCKCGAPISHIPIESVNGQKIGEIAPSKCPAYGEKSGFNLRGDQEEQLRLVARLTKDRNLKVRLKIKGPE